MVRRRSDPTVERGTLNRLDEILTRERLDSVRRLGLLIFDVDDTLLARRTGPTAEGEVFSESPAAQNLPLLLGSGMRICVITGHGWKQLEKRLIGPTVDAISHSHPSTKNDILKSFFVYANRGATRLEWKDGTFCQDQDYGQRFVIGDEHVQQLRSILEELRALSIEAQGVITEREGVVLGLRPVLPDAKGGDSARKRLSDIGNEAIRHGGLAEKYRLLPAGKTTLEVTNKLVSKRAAFEDLMMRVARDLGIYPAEVEQSSVYIGDEFSPSGNDRVLTDAFPRCLFFSVSARGERVSSNVVELESMLHKSGTKATWELTQTIMKVLV